MDVLLPLLVFVLVFGLVAYVIFWLMGYLAVPDPIRKIVTVIIVIVGIIMLLGYLPGLGGHWSLPWPYR